MVLVTERRKRRRHDHLHESVVEVVETSFFVVSMHHVIDEEVLHFGDLGNGMILHELQLRDQVLEKMGKMINYTRLQERLDDIYF